MGQASCLSFVTQGADPKVEPASAPATREQPARRPVLLDARVRGHDDTRMPVLPIQVHGRHLFGTAVGMAHPS